jgi:type VI secretion system Hcp family effector
MHAFLDTGGRGTAQQEAVKGKTPVTGFNHQADQDGAGVFVVRKKIDAQSPEFHDALTSKKALPKCTLHFWHMPRSGTEENYVTMELEGAKIAWISWVMPDLQVPGNELIHEYEDIAFTYTKMTVASVGKKG